MLVFNPRSHQYDQMAKLFVKYFAIFCHCNENLPNINFCQIRFKFYQFLNKLSENRQILLKLCQSGKMRQNLVTLDAIYQAKPFFPFQNEDGVKDLGVARGPGRSLAHSRTSGEWWQLDKRGKWPRDRPRLVWRRRHWGRQWPWRRRRLGRGFWRWEQFDALGPMLQNSFAPTAKFTHYFCWLGHLKMSFYYPTSH